MEFVSPEGFRLDGRRPMEMRQIRAEIGAVANADGSALFEMGNTKVIAAVYGPREVQNRSQQINDQALGLKMGSSVEAIQAAKVYRQLLKAVKKHVDKEEKKSHFIEFISQEFRTSHEQLDLSSIHQKIKLARDYTFLLNSVHHHKDLLFSYNIAVDRSDEMKKVLGKSAASVGLQLPEVYQS
ncbi:hypothetical protein TEA_015412 [Camellia sinensis var. sinensis]|uniref:Exoribonuclease phosphorolytic domain-containing protein n=1 Tax=Camellia sinensis var. sinensis TaxID=542762 RepID=A0A4S4DMK5_CAMSN|nr:hypothetical protein TEA_015412 [Camellia sinensis var. sinensis]